VVTHLFENLDLNRVLIQCARGNERSCAVARRLGFAEEGASRESHWLRGEFLDMRRFAMLKRDWKPEPSRL
jgi:ribosomal-protein-serine acetyltransferase